MEYIASYAKTREIIEKHGFSVKKGYGQNFLVDQHVLNKIMTGADITSHDLVIEIGPGFGGLTQALAEKAGQVVAIEIDKKLLPILEETLHGYTNVEIINSDVLKLDIPEIISRYSYQSVKLIANLPYYITTPIIMKVLENRYPIQMMLVMIQKEVAERMQAAPATKEYGALSLAVQYYSEPYLVANVPQNCFLPRPSVDSAVIRLQIHDKPPVEPEDPELMFQIIKAAFQMRRKTLVNCLFSADFIQLSKEELGKLLVSCGLDERVRGETLGLGDFSRIANEVKKTI